MGGSPSFQQLMAMAASNATQITSRVDELKKAQVKEKAKELMREREQLRLQQEERRRMIEQARKRESQKKEEAKNKSSRTRKERPPLSAEEARIMREKKDKERLEMKRRAKTLSYQELIRQAPKELPKTVPVKQNPPASAKHNNASRETHSKNYSLEWLREAPASNGRSSTVRSSSSKMNGLTSRRTTTTAISGTGSRSSIPNDLVRLQTGPKRDKRTAAEIQDEIARKKFGASSSSGRASAMRNTPSGSSARNSTVPRKPLPRRKPRVEDDDIDGFIEPDSDSEIKPDISSEIWKIFGKRKTDYVGRDMYSDDDDVMEASGHDVWREEQAAARQARLEDEREARLERDREMMKKKRKKITS
ncbi:non-specific DNA binding protein Spt2 [Schizosaccharomyces japonicus yFS275]|uniref:Non-specific DNA binding protein Spt2 n=1 Tax=Schizosaccharomyces japonicus (strain yFS275 / FY16936) TaxID=402676 RepID=B6K6C8_SCHJY|nr:non-specific DNA binding protein Spt2 [Schizosaccharomyces japonicus yFS275]EEB09082.1 non-specific DNA binding protein Spt2 [Schizosaccharomyces japonicus yFS275]